MSWFKPVSLMALLLLIPLQRVAAQTSLGLLPAQGAQNSEAGQRFTYICPPGSGANAVVYGTEVYTGDSAVCAAAIHAGRLGPNEVGVVSILIGTVAGNFTGSTRNGVTTRSYGQGYRSYTFVSDGQPAPITWRTTWSQIPPEFRGPVSLECPPGGSAGSIWGTGIYARDSAICTAAVHAGAIRLDTGGVIIVQRAVTNAPFLASEQNGVRSAPWSALPDAFSVSAAPSGPASSAAALNTAASSVPASTRPAGSAVARVGRTAPLTIANDAELPAPSSTAVRNTEPLILIVPVGTDFVIAWPPVLGAVSYGVAGSTQALWRQVLAPATAVLYNGLPRGEYTFAVGAYFEPGAATTPISEWQRVRVNVVTTIDRQRMIEQMNRSAELLRQMQNELNIRP